MSNKKKTRNKLSEIEKKELDLLNSLFKNGVYSDSKDEFRSIEEIRTEINKHGCCDELTYRQDLWMNITAKTKMSEQLNFDDVTELFNNKSVNINDVTFNNKVSDIIKASKKYDIKTYKQFINEHFRFIKKKFFYEHPVGRWNARYETLKCEDITHFEYKFKNEIDSSNEDSEILYNKVKSHLHTQVGKLKQIYWSNAKTHRQRVVILNDLKLAQQNIRNFLLCCNGFNFNDAYIKTLSTDIYPSGGAVTITKSNSINAVSIAKNLNKNIGTLGSVSELIDMIQNPNTNLAYERAIKRTETMIDEEKIKEIKDSAKSRLFPIVFMTNNGCRPQKGLAGVEFWSGLQIFDLDIKNDKNGIKAEDIKHTLHKFLCKYAWYLGVKSSISGNGLHVITKCIPPHLVYKTTIDNEDLQNFYHKLNYFQKFGSIKWLLLNECGLSNDSIFDVLDKSLSRITQGIVINHDPNFLLNSKFCDLPLALDFLKPPKTGLKAKEWMMLDDNKEHLFKKIKNKKTMRKDYSLNRPVNNISIKLKSENVNLPKNFSKIRKANIMKLKPGQRDYARASIIRTCVYLFGETCFDLLYYLLNVGVDFSEGEFEGKFNYALRNPKLNEISLSILKNCGVNVEYTTDKEVEDLKESELMKKAKDLKESTINVGVTSSDVCLRLDDKNKYLSNIKNELLDSLVDDKINLIESAPGTGKTHLFNNLSKTHRILLVEPYVSVLKNKIEKDETTNKIFDVVYGDKQIKIEEGKSIATTFDKFSRMELEEYKQFDIIAIDESHLLYTSMYRERVTSAAVRNSRMFIEEERKNKSIDFSLGSTSLLESSYVKTIADEIKNIRTKIIFMTGTVTGEILHFKELGLLNYIKISHQHPYKKEATFVLTENPDNKKYALLKYMADAINDGYTVICPTNSGDLYTDDTIDALNIFIDKDKKIKEGEFAYYKKSTSSNSISHSINEHSLLPDEIKILFCTVYLGVGVDIINENKKFKIIYDASNFTAQDIDQYNNRIRRSDIECVLLYNVTDNDDKPMLGFDKVDQQIILLDPEKRKKDIEDDKTISKSIFNMNNDSKKLLPEFVDLKANYHVIKGDSIVFNDDRFKMRHYSTDFYKIASLPAYVKFSLENNYAYKVKIECFEQPKNIDLLLNEIDSIERMNRDFNQKQKIKAYLNTSETIIENFDTLSEVGFNLELIPAPNKEFTEDFEKVTEIKEDGFHTTYRLTFSQRYEELVRQAIIDTKFLLRYYSAKTTKEIIEKHKTEKRINFKELNRDICLIRMINLNRKHMLPIPTLKGFKTINNFIKKYSKEGMSKLVDIDENGVATTDDTGMLTLKNRLTDFADKFYKTTGEAILKTDRRRNEMFEKTEDFLKVFCKISKRKENFKLTKRQVPKFDSKSISVEIKYDEIIHDYVYGDWSNITTRSIDIVDTSEESLKELKDVSSLDDFEIGI